MNILRKNGSSHGEPTWQGFRYKLPMRDAKVQGFVLEKKGSLYKLLRNVPEPVKIDPIGPTEDKLESDFFQSFGTSLNLDFSPGQTSARMTTTFRSICLMLDKPSTGRK